MITKPFLLLLVVALVLGGSLGGAFAGGVALGKSQGKEAVRNRTATPEASSLWQQPSNVTGQEQPGQTRQQPQSGGGAGGQSFAGRGGLIGTVENVNGNTLTINTAQGLSQATISADTTIQKFAPITLADLQTGTRVAIFGQRREDGTVQARYIILTPEGAEAFFGGSGPRSNRPSPP